MQVYSSRFPSRKPKSEKWGQWISSRQYCNNRLLLLSLISDMCNPKNWKSSSRAKWNCSKSGWIRVLQIHRQGRPGKCVFLCDLDWQLAIETSETKPRRAPASIQCTGVRQTNNGCVQACFFLPSPSLFSILTCQPLPWNHFLTRPNSRLVWTSKLIAL